MCLFLLLLLPCSAVLGTPEGAGTKPPDRAAADGSLVGRLWGTSVPRLWLVVLLRQLVPDACCSELLIVVVLLLANVDSDVSSSAWEKLECSFLYGFPKF